MIAQSDDCMFIYMNKEIPPRSDFLFQIEAKLILGSEYHTYLLILHHGFINLANS